jgi:hypothetical protein
MPSDFDLVLNRIEQQLGRGLQPEEIAEIQVWDRGKRLSSLVNYPGWEDVEDMLRGYVTKAEAELKNIPPWERDKVANAHAVVYAANEIVQTFFRDVQLAVQMETPASLREAVANQQ